jgi:hypothetical protein
MFKLAWQTTSRSVRIAVGTGLVAGIVGTWYCGMSRERRRVTEVELVTKAPGLIMLHQDPFIQAWQRAMHAGTPAQAGGYAPVLQAAQSRGETWRMPGNLVVPKDTKAWPLQAPVQEPDQLPLTVLDTHPPTWDTSAMSNPWLAVCLVPIPFMLAFRAGCLCAPVPQGCTDKVLLQHVLCDPKLQSYMKKSGADPLPFSEVFSLKI